jgi:hypothetical protein
MVKTKFAINFDPPKFNKKLSIMYFVDLEKPHKDEDRVVSCHYSIKMAVKSWRKVNKSGRSALLMMYSQDEFGRTSYEFVPFSLLHQTMVDMGH